MNATDKQQAWEALVKYVRAHLPSAAHEEKKWGERRMIERVVVHGISAEISLQRLHNISVPCETLSHSEPTIGCQNMNAIDKQHAFDMIAAHLITRGLLSPAATQVQRVVEVVDEMVSSHEALKKLQRVAEVGTEKLLFIDEDIAVLRILVSTAVWIRSEQLANPNALLKVYSLLDSIYKETLATEIDTHNLHIHNLTHEFQAGQKLYTKLADYCRDHAIPDPEWRK